VSTQEEERERRMDFVPEESAVNTETIEVRKPCAGCICVNSSCFGAITSHDLNTAMQWHFAPPPPPPDAYFPLLQLCAVSGKLLHFVRDPSSLQYQLLTELSCLQIDQDTNDLLRSLNMVNLPGVKMVPVSLSLVLCLMFSAAVPLHCVPFLLSEQA